MPTRSNTALAGATQVVPGAKARSLEDWWRLSNISDAEVAKLINGVYKSGVADKASPGQ